MKSNEAYPDRSIIVPDYVQLLRFCSYTSEVIAEPIEGQSLTVSCQIDRIIEDENGTNPLDEQIYLELARKKEYDDTVANVVYTTRLLVSREVMVDDGDRMIYDTCEEFSVTSLEPNPVTSIGLRPAYVNSTSTGEVTENLYPRRKNTTDEDRARRMVAHDHAWEYANGVIRYLAERQGKFRKPGGKQPNLFTYMHDL